ncbi:hypothetical protein AeNC1_010778 [Aphanomyces euteiches]|nr:hypothetical protein AeNC1_010778 [Aphanomyces euteiches]
MGILVGDLGVGIAPGAQWISRRGCGATCDESVLLSCMQFMLCPTDAQGNNADCSKKPHVINNSWGSSVTKTAYLSAFQAWEDAGILAVTSAGNAGPLCSSVGSPADYPTALDVGMMTQDFLLNSRTSRGPPKNDSNVIKPDISAPGLSGTSQAAPHVAGTAALMLAANPSLTPAQIRTALKTHVETAWIILGVGGQNCGGVDDLTFPNNNFGAGLVNASFAVESVATSSPLPAPTTSSPTPATTQGPTDAPTTQVPFPTATTGSPSTAPVSTTKAPTTTSTTRVPTSTATTTKTPTTTATTQKPNNQATNDHNDDQDTNVDGELSLNQVWEVRPPGLSRAL